MSELTDEALDKLVLGVVETASYEKAQAIAKRFSDVCVKQINADIQVATAYFIAHLMEQAPAPAASAIPWIIMELAMRMHETIEEEKEP